METDAARYRSLRCLALSVVTIGGLASCQGSHEVADARTECLDAVARGSADPVELVSCRVSSGENDLRFFVGVRNVDAGPLKVRVRLELFNQFEVRMRRVGGEVVPPENIWEPADVGLDQVTYLLPRGGVLGRVLDLACLQPDVGAALEPCARAYDLGPGEFEVWFEYADIWVCRDEPCEQDQTWSGSIESPRLRVIVP